MHKPTRRRARVAIATSRVLKRAERLESHHGWLLLTLHDPVCHHRKQQQSHRQPTAV